MPTTIHNTGITFPDATTQTTAASAGGQVQTELFTAPGTWTKPASCTQVRVTVIGGGGGANVSGPGGAGGFAVAQVPVSAPVAITVGSGGQASPGVTSGGTSSFGPAVSATGGSAGSPISNGTGTVSLGTSFKTGNIGVTAPSAGIISGLVERAGPAQPGISYSNSSAFFAGARGGAPGGGGVGGAVVVEFVG